MHNALTLKLAAGFPNVCSVPDYQSGPLDSEDYDDCIYNEIVPGSMELAEEIVAAGSMTNSITSGAQPGPVTLEYESQCAVCSLHIVHLELQTHTSMAQSSPVLCK